MDATVNALTDVEQEWLRDQLAAAARFVADYGSARHPSVYEGGEQWFLQSTHDAIVAEMGQLRG